MTSQHNIELLRAKEELLRLLPILKTKLAQTDHLFRSARNWGIVDMLSVGLLATAIKYGKLQEASKLLGDIRYYLDRFNQPLKVVYQQKAIKNTTYDPLTEIDRFTQILDFGLARFIAAISVQGEIGLGRRQLKVLKQDLTQIEQQYMLTDDAHSYKIQVS
ncbi:MAG: hypothetical protein AAGJ93_18135 [Bacteroidota bacterium]